MGLVKGITRRVILVKSPDPKLFEQAIFIMREEAFNAGVTAEQVLQQAQQVADGYVRKNSRWGKVFSSLPRIACAALGALLASAAWGIAMFYPLFL